MAIVAWMKDRQTLGLFEECKTTAASGPTTTVFGGKHWLCRSLSFQPHAPKLTLDS